MLTNLAGKILKYVRIFLPYTHEEGYYQRVNEEMEKFLDESDADRNKILGVGISFPGIVDLDKKMITYSHILGVRMVAFDSVSCFLIIHAFFE